jgi:hypothetical protein
MRRTAGGSPRRKRTFRPLRSIWRPRDDANGRSRSLLNVPNASRGWRCPYDWLNYAPIWRVYGELEIVGRGYDPVHVPSHLLHLSIFACPYLWDSAQRHRPNLHRENRWMVMPALDLVSRGPGINLRNATAGSSERLPVIPCLTVLTCRLPGTCLYSACLSIWSSRTVTGSTYIGYLLRLTAINAGQFFLKWPHLLSSIVTHEST